MGDMRAMRACLYAAGCHIGSPETAKIDCSGVLDERMISNSIKISPETRLREFVDAVFVAETDSRVNATASLALAMPGASGM